MKAVLYSGHVIAEMSHDNNVRMVCIDTYEEYTVCFINGVANIHIDLDNNHTDWVWLRCGLVVKGGG